MPTRITLFFLAVICLDAITAQSSFFQQYGEEYPGPAFGFTLTSEGGYMITGRSSGLRLLKVDSNGDALWQTSFNGLYGKVGLSVIETADGGFLAAGTQGKPDTSGHNYAAAYAVKTNAVGDSVWTFVWDENVLNRSEIKTVLQPDDSTYILAGTTDAEVNTGSLSKAFLQALDTAGNEQWISIYNERTYLLDAVTTPDGGYLIGGLYGSFYSSFTQPYLAKMDAEGNLLWERNDGWGLFAGRIESVLQLDDYSFMVCGTVTDSDFRKNVFVSKLDHDGDLIWIRQYGNEASHEEGTKIINHGSKGVVFAGVTGNNTTGAFDQSDIWLVNLNADGEVLWERSYGTEDADIVTGLQACPDGGFAMTGYSLPYQNPFLVKTDSLGQVDAFTSTNDIAASSAQAVLLSPNPVVNILTVELSETSFSMAHDLSYTISDAVVTVRRRATVAPGEVDSQNSFTVDVAGLAAGSYYLSIVLGEKHYQANFIKL